jgi:hypothetical protein
MKNASALVVSLVAVLSLAAPASAQNRKANVLVVGEGPELTYFQSPAFKEAMLTAPGTADLVVHTNPNLPEEFSFYNMVVLTSRAAQPVPAFLGDELKGWLSVGGTLLVAPSARTGIDPVLGLLGSGYELSWSLGGGCESVALLTQTMSRPNPLVSGCGPQGVGCCDRLRITSHGPAYSEDARFIGGAASVVTAGFGEGIVVAITADLIAQPTLSSQLIENLLRLRHAYFDFVSPIFNLQPFPQYTRTPSQPIFGDLTDDIEVDRVTIQNQATGEVQVLGNPQPHLPLVMMLALPLAEGPNVVNFTGRDWLGKTRVLTRVTFLDTQAPTLSSLTPVGYTNNPNPTVSVAVADNHQVAVVEFLRDGVLLGSTTPSNGQASLAVALNPRNNAIRVRAYDAAGNETVIDHPMILDTVRPEARAFFPDSISETTEVFSNLRDDQRVARATWYVNGRPQVTQTFESGNDLYYTATLRFVPGYNTYYLEVEDAAGNLSEGPTARGLLHNGVPELTFGPLPQVTNQAALNVSYTARDDHGFLLLSLDHNGTGTFAVNRDGLGAVENAWVNLTPGENSIRISAICNASVTNQVFATVVYDPQAPEVVMPSVEDTRNPDFTFVAAVTDNDVLTRVVVRHNAAVVFSDLPEADGKVTVALNLVEGGNSFQVEATDRAGNTTHVVLAPFRLDTRNPELNTEAPPALSRLPEHLLRGTYADVDGSGVSSVKVYVEDVLQATQLADGRFESRLVFTGEGVNSVRVVAADRVGNSTEQRFSIHTDFTPPVARLVSVPSITNQRELEVSNEISDNLAVTSAVLSLNGQRVSDAVPHGGTTRITLAEGRNELLLVVRDQAGNETSAFAELKLDTIAPRVWFLSPAEDQVNGVSRNQIIFEVDDASPYTATVGTFSQWVDLPAAFVTYVELPDEGRNAVVATAVDDAGNIGTATRHIIIDFTAPAVDLDFAPDLVLGKLPGDQFAYAIRIDDLTGTTVTTAELGQVRLPAGGQVLNVLRTLVEGRNTISVKVEDTIGRVTTLERSLTYDTTGPAGEFVAPSANALVRGTIDLALNASDAHTSVVNVDVDVDGQPVLGAFTGGSWSARFDTAGLTEGRHTATARLVDALGNVSQLTTSFDVDNLAPAVSITGLTEGQVVSGTVNVTVRGTDAVSLSLKLNGTPIASCAAAICTASIDTRSLLNGPFVLVAGGADAAGNAAALVQVTAIADNSAPSRFLISPVSGAVVTGSLKVQVKVVDSAFASVECQVDGTSLGASTDPLFTRTVSTLDKLDGPALVKCTVVDRAGNTGVETAVVTVNNWSEKLNPNQYNLNGLGGLISHLTSGLLNGAETTVTFKGANVALLSAVQAGTLTLAVPGGGRVALKQRSSVRSGWLFQAPELELAFSRAALLNALNAGVRSGAITRGSATPLRILVGEREIGSDTVTVR